ncbi:hypothetical protein ACLKA7_013604 [Drosophila subpalustris]
MSRVLLDGPVAHLPLLLFLFLLFLNAEFQIPNTECRATGSCQSPLLSCGLQCRQVSLSHRTLAIGSNGNGNRMASSCPQRGVVGVEALRPVRALTSIVFVCGHAHISPVFPLSRTLITLPFRLDDSF